VAVASAGPYANHLHLAPDRKPRQYPTIQFLQAAYPSCHPTNSIKPPKANFWLSIFPIHSFSILMALKTCKVVTCHSLQEEATSNDVHEKQAN